MLLHRHPPESRERGVTGATRIVLVDDHALFRESVARLLEVEPGFVVAGSYGSGDEALRRIGSDAPDVVLLDFDLGPMDGSEFLDRARAAGYRGRVLVVTAGVRRFETAELIRKGVSGIVMKHSSPAHLAQGIRDVVDGKVRLDEEQLRAVVDEAGPPAVSDGTPLTAREATVLHHVFEGLTNKEIGRELGISESAVKASLQQLFDKTGVRTRGQLVRIALERFRDQL
jgi:two-component system nitrate/nitrite response regulator NarL